MLRECSQEITPAPAREAEGAYTRREVCRLLKIDLRRLRSWERQELIPRLQQFKFADLLLLKRLLRLRDENATPLEVRTAMGRLRGYLNDNSDLSQDVQVYKDGNRIRIKIGRQRLEAGSGQLLLDFATDELDNLMQLPHSPSRSGASIAEKLRDKLEADRWFEHGLNLESSGAPYEEIIEAYRKAADLDPRSAGARVNLGTIYFNGHAWADAETEYRKALEIDPDYALPHFNLGNLYDERGDTEAALLHYQEAIRLYPNYADAHYNLALFQQSRGDVLSAVKHWRAYLKLDARSTWAEIARRELAKLEKGTIVQGSRPSAPKLFLVKGKNP